VYFVSFSALRRRLLGVTGASARRVQQLNTKETLKSQNQKTWQSGKHYETDSESATDDDDVPNSPIRNSVKEINTNTAIQLSDDDEMKLEPTTDTQTQQQDNDDDVNIPTLEPQPSLRRSGVIVQRAECIEKSRAKLPIIGEEQRIIETINENDVRVLFVCFYAKYVTPPTGNDPIR
jgi:hypothetical protein